MEKDVENENSTVVVEETSKVGKAKELANNVSCEMHNKLSTTPAVPLIIEELKSKLEDLVTQKETEHDQETDSLNLDLEQTSNDGKMEGHRINSSSRKFSVPEEVAMAEIDVHYNTVKLLSQPIPATVESITQEKGEVKKSTAPTKTFDAKVNEKEQRTEEDRGDDDAVEASGLPQSDSRPKRVSNVIGKLFSSKSLKSADGKGSSNTSGIVILDSTENITREQLDGHKMKSKKSNYDKIKSRSMIKKSPNSEIRVTHDEGSAKVKSSIQPIPAAINMLPSSEDIESVGSSEKRKEKDHNKKRSDDDSITEDASDSRCAVMTRKHSEWSDYEEASGLPRSDTRIDRVTRAVRQFFCCGVRYEAPSEDDVSTYRDYYGGI